MSTVISPVFFVPIRIIFFKLWTLAVVPFSPRIIQVMSLMQQFPFMEFRIWFFSSLIYMKTPHHGASMVIPFLSVKVPTACSMSPLVPRRKFFFNGLPVVMPSVSVMPQIIVLITPAICIMLRIKFHFIKLSIVILQPFVKMIMSMLPFLLTRMFMVMPDLSTVLQKIQSF